MNPERWEAIGVLFEQALAAPTAERRALVEQSPQADDEVRREVLSLLASYNASPGGFVQNRIHGALESFYRTAVSGAMPPRVGAYRLVRELGRGGMGTVFLAERDDDEYHAKVAIKLVRPGMDTDFILARFRRERQTLARLQHPNISRLLDGGTTDDGLPYIVMEYIDGPWITTYAATRGLGSTERLELFFAVCSAVDFAHRNFIVHRDLKPGNILVDPSGVPKLLDFGICKLLTTEGLSPADTVAAPMTPSYASPEQIRGEPATILSDVYSLGAVLYELLTGVCPRQFANLSPGGIERALERPVPLASAVAADSRIARRLAGDLDNVLRVALDDDPARRYESAAQFADDLRRSLANEPVRARPPSTAYVASKFVARHRGAVAAAASIFAALTAGVAISTYESRIAAARLRQVRTLANRLVFDLHDAVKDLPGATKARQIIVQTGLDYLESAAVSAKGDPAAELELARAYRRLGDVQGGEGSNLGDPQSARARYRSAQVLLDAAIRDGLNTVEAKTERLALYKRLGALERDTGQLPNALRIVQEGIRVGTPDAASGDAAFRGALAELYIASAEAKRNMGNAAGSLQDAADAVRLFRGAIGLSASDLELTHALASALAEVGMAESLLGRLDRALTNYQQGAGEMEKLVSASPQNVSWKRDLMLAYGHIADVLGNPNLQNMGDRAGALRMYRRAAEIGRALYDADPADQRAASDFGIVLSRVESAMDDNDPAARLAVQRESLAVLERAAAINSGNISLRLYRSSVEEQMGDTLTAAGDIESARKAYLQSATMASDNMASGNATFVLLYIRSTRKLAVNAVARRRRAEALAYANQARQAGERPPAGAAALRALPRALSAMGLTYAALVGSPVRAPGDLEQARSWLRKALEAWREAQNQPGFAAPQRREMREIENALARIEQR